jgi:hypothetical protein
MSGAMKVPFLDLVTLHAELKEELCKVFEAALDTAGFIGGPMVQGFEEDFAKYCDATQCVGVGSGRTRSVCIDRRRRLGLRRRRNRAEHVHRDAEAISQAGARIVFVDRRSDLQSRSGETAKYLENRMHVDAASQSLVDRKTKP